MPKKTKKENANEPSKGSRIYIGKPLAGLPQFTIFKGGELPPHVLAMAKNNADILGLIVPLNELQQARKDMHTKGHILNYYYSKQN